MGVIDGQPSLGDIGFKIGRGPEKRRVHNSFGEAKLVRHADGTSSGVWESYELKSAFQPIALNDGKLSITAFEGLLRPFLGQGYVPPMEFFAGVPSLERLHIETLARTMHLMNAAAFLGHQAAIYINFDPSLFVERAVVDLALRNMQVVLHEAGVEPARVVCEVTEQKSGSKAALFGFVEALRGRGLRIAVDDFGAEDSDIRRIEELMPDVVKFDAGLVMRLMESGPGFALLKTMLETFSARGIATVLEGIEEDWQLELAERSGTAMVQGYALGRPEIVPGSFFRLVGDAPLPAREAAAARPDSPVGAMPDPKKPFGRRRFPK